MYVVDPLLFFRGTTIFICNGCSLYKCWVVAKAVDYRTHMYLEYCERRLGWSTSYAFPIVIMLPYYNMLIDVLDAKRYIQSVNMGVKAEK